MEKSKGFKQKIVKVIIGFVSVMLVCTIVSKTIYTYLLPVVRTTKAKSESIEVKTITTGKVGIDETQLKSAQAKLMPNISGKVVEVYKEELEEVKAGETICVVQKKDYEVSSKTHEIEYTQLLQQQDSLSRKKQSQEMSRQRLIEEYEEKKQELEQVKNLTKLVNLDESIASQEELVKADKELFEGGFLSKQEYQQEVQRLTELKRQRKDEEENTIEEIEEALKALDEKIDTLDESILELGEEQVLLSKKLELAQEEKSSEVIVAPISGYLYTLNVSEGAYVQENEVLGVILPADLSYSLSFEVSDEVASKIQTGQSVNFKLAQIMEKATVAKKQFSEESGNMKVIATLQEDTLRKLALDYKSYKMVSVEIVSSSSSYPCVVDNSAIQTIYTNHYVFVIEEKEGIGEKSYRVRRVSVTILEEGDYKTAIEGAINRETLIVNSNIGKLTDGAEVMLEVGDAS